MNFKEIKKPGKIVFYRVSINLFSLVGFLIL